MKYLVLVNPSSHGGRAGRRWRRLQPLLPDAEFVLLDDIGQARELARTAAGYETVVACGGDGTVNAVADGVMANPDENLKFGVVYMGTSPDFCRFHGIPTDLTAAVELLQSPAVKHVPVLMANGRCFFCSCNIGIGAAVAALSNRLRPYLGDALGTFVALLRGLLRGERHDYDVNGEKQRNCNHLLFTRMPYIASGLRIHVPQLREDEYVLWHVRNLSFGGWLKLIPRLYRGETCGEVRVCRGKTNVTCGQPVELEYDGDPHGMLPVEIAFAGRRLKLVAKPSLEVQDA